MAKKKQVKGKYYTKTKLVLSNNELRDIINNLKKGIPLDDRYRFLLFGDKKEVELIWNGKSGEVSNIVLPFQTIEQVDEPRKEKDGGEKQATLFDVDESGRQIGGWVNKLIWGDNKLVLSSLKNGPLREEIEKQGGIKLIYIDPPFSAGIDYSIDVAIGEKIQDKLTKSPSILEEFAYRNTWGSGGNTFLQMLYERIMIMKDLLANDGIFFLRIDYHWGHYVKAILDEIFNKSWFQSEIIVNRIKKNVTGQGKLSMPTSTDSVFVYFKSENSKFKHLNKQLDKIREGYWRRTDDSSGERRPRERRLFGKIFLPPPGKHFKFSQANMEKMIEEKRLQYNERLDRLEYWVKPSSTKVLDTNWTDIPGYSFTTNYPTENSETLLQRIIDIGTNPGDLVCDFFCGSGTTLAVAEKLGRKWIGSDLGKFSIHTTRKRMIGVQRQLKKDRKDFRAFEILNMGRYERQHYVGVNPNLRDEEKQKQLAKKEQDFVKLILHAYRAEAVQGFNTFSGKKLSRMVAIGPINLPVGRLFVEETINEAVKNKLTKVDILAFEFEFGLAPHIQDEAKQRGVNLALKQIPKEVFDKRAVEKNQVVFTDVSYIEITPHYEEDKIAIELADFSVFYNQDSVKYVEENLRNNSNKVVIENGNIIKISKDKDGILTRETLTKSWTDWIDYWAVDFDFESKKEIIRRPKQKKQTGKLDLEIEYEEVETGDYIFENEWQSFRTKKDRELELKTPFKKIYGKMKIAIKVVDIFGNDTMKIIEVKGRSK